MFSVKRDRDGKVFTSDMSAEESIYERLVRLRPTEGAYQKEKTGRIFKETKTLITVSVDGVIGEWVFSKKDMLRTGAYKNEFPRWLLIAT